MKIIKNNSEVRNIIPRSLYLTKANLENNKLSLSVRATEEEKPLTMRLLFLPRRGILSEQTLAELENIDIPLEFESIYIALSWSLLDDFQMHHIKGRGINNFELTVHPDFGITKAEDLEIRLEKLYLESSGVFYECYFLESTPKIV